jgi:hypothetical protein
MLKEKQSGKKMDKSPPKAASIVPEKILFRNIKITNAQVNASEDAEASWEEVALSVSTKTLFNESNGCRVVFVLDIEKLNEDGLHLIKANFTIDFDFEVENMADFVKKTEDTSSVEVSAELGTALMGIVYSTARGIVLTRTAGTVLDGIILPVIDPALLLEGESKL